MTYDAENVLLDGLRRTLRIGANDGVPEPRGRVMFYPWLDMEVDETFTFRDGVKTGSARVLACRASDIYAPRRFSTRTVRASGRKFVICKRVA
jgi:hypothetical protein